MALDALLLFVSNLALIGVTTVLIVVTFEGIRKEQIESHRHEEAQADNAQESEERIARIATEVIKADRAVKGGDTSDGK